MAKFLTIKITLSDYPGNPDNYISRIDSSPQGASPGPGFSFTLPAVPGGESTFQLYLKKLNADSNPVRQIRDLGKALFNAVFQDGIRDKYNNVLGQVRSEVNSKLRIALNILSPKLINVPWELLHDGNGHILQDGATSVVRVIDELIAPRESFGPITKPIIIVANPGQVFNAKAHIESIQQEFVQGKVLPENIYVLERATTNNIFDFLQQNPEADFLYFLGHGGIDGNGDGVIVLESDAKAKGDYVSAQHLAAVLKAQTNIRLVYFNSCSTAESGIGTFSGVAQNIMLYGNVVSVVAMQAPIAANKGMDLTRLFISKIMQIETVEEALSTARYQFLADSFTWAIPVIYTHVQGPDDFEKNQILSLLGSSLRNKKYALCIPSFKNTLLEEELAIQHFEIQIKVNGHDVNDFYHYPGLSFAQSDVTATDYIRSMLLRITSLDNIKTLPGIDIQEDTESDCIFLFGSRSNTYVSQVLNGYISTFHLSYTKTEWYIVDEEFHKKYTIAPPYLSPKEEWDKMVDYCCIQKIIAQTKVYIMISGLGDRGTVGGSWWFAKNWKWLLSQSGIGQFSYLLRLPTSNYSTAEVIDRTNNPYGTDM